MYSEQHNKRKKYGHTKQLKARGERDKIISEDSFSFTRQL